MFVMHSYLARVQPFLPPSPRRVSQNDDIDHFRHDDGNVDEDDDNGEDITEVYDDVDEEYVKLIIPYGGSEGPASFRAVRNDNMRTPSRLKATVIRIPNGDRI